MTTIRSVNPATSESVETGLHETTSSGIDALADAAAGAAAPYEALGREFRAALLREIAAQLESHRAQIIAVAHRETALPEARLAGELTRTVFQAQFFADVIDEGSYLEAMIDHAHETPMGPAPDLRRMLVPLGPVAVFGASNFPLAFSVPGGDTVAALAAGCPVIVKAHDAHPELSALTFAALTAAAQTCGAPDGLLGLVYGFQAGAELVAHPSIAAVSFTGSREGGEALLDIIAKRQIPIPFYGEMSGLNPIIVTERASLARTTDIAEGLIASITVSSGQLCTKPGVVLVPRGKSGDRLVAAAVNALTAVPDGALLNERIRSKYRESIAALAELPGANLVGTGHAARSEGFFAEASVFQIDAENLRNEVLVERFGPTAVFVRYDDASLDSALKALPASLTATIHSEDDEVELTAELTTHLKPKAGRLLYNQFPTGVAVGWAQHHGGPWPSTNSLHTSVGATSIRRFLRPVVWQNALPQVLPIELKEQTLGVPRRVDGKFGWA